MKKTIYLLCIVLFMAFTFIASPAKAQDTPCQDGDPITGSCPVNTGGTSLPINSGVIYLLAAGLIIGMVAIKKHKNAIRIA